MDRDQISNFLALSRIGSFSKAEDTLHITKTALKRQMDLLEKEVGFPLFIRTSKGVRLTSLGEEYASIVQELMDSHDHFISVFRKRAHPPKDKIKIGLLFTTYLLDIIQETQEATGLSMEIIMLDNMKRNVGVQMLYDNQIDFLEWHNDLSSDLSQFCFHSLVMDEMCCLVSAKHPFAEYDSIDFSMLKDQDVFYSVKNKDTANELIYMGIKNDVVLKHSETSLTSIVNTCNKKGIYILSRRFADSFSPLKPIPLKPTVNFKWGLVYKPDKEIYIRLMQLHAADKDGKLPRNIM